MSPIELVNAKDAKAHLGTCGLEAKNTFLI
jgi:hypothetical protein